MRSTISFTALLFLLLSAGCASRMSGASQAGAAGPELAIDRFLRSAAARDYVAMGWIFGTVDGAILQRDPAGQVEQRMYALAHLIEHDGFTIGPASPVPGRTGEALLFEVVLRQGAESAPLPFITVRGPGGSWYVEQLAVEAITSR